MTKKSPSMANHVRHVFVITAALFVTLSQPLYMPAYAYSLEDILSAPYPENLVASSNGERIAWTQTQQGARSVWTAAAPDFEPVQIASFPNDDGRPLGQLSLSADGRFAVFTRGGPKNWDGDHPNPNSDAKGATQQVWLAKTNSDDARLVADGASPALSPDGKTVLIQHEGDVFAYPTNNRKTNVETPFFSVRGALQNIRWSPDGEKVAFVSARNGHSFVGIFDTTTEDIHWMAPSVYRDMHPAWSPDSTQIAFMRRAGRLNGERRHLMISWPFSIMVADIETGKAEEVWQSPTENAGGLAQRYFPKPLYWTASDRLVFYSEHDDFMRAYSVSPDGGALTALTPENCETEDTAISLEGSTLIYAHNCGDTDRRHLASVPINGGTPQAITSGEGIETHPVPLANDVLAYRAAGAKQPTRIALLKDGDTIYASAAPPAEFPGDAMVTPQQVTFQSSDGFTVHGQLFAPTEIDEGNTRPALIFMHGGPIRQMLLGWHYRGYYANAYAMNQYLASQGYVVLAVNFRAGIGYGQKFRLVPDHGPRGASEYNDILAAAAFLKSHALVDGEKIGLWGGSYGGLLTAQGLARDSDIFAAGVDIHGVHDWSLDFPNRPGRWWGLAEDEMALARRSSPIADIDGWRSPVLFIHGDDDRNVVFWETTDLAMRLNAKGVHWEALVLPDEVHGFYRHTSWLQTYEATAEFFDRMLKTPLTE